MVSIAAHLVLWCEDKSWRGNLLEFDRVFSFFLDLLLGLLENFPFTTLTHFSNLTQIGTGHRYLLIFASFVSVDTPFLQKLVHEAGLALNGAIFARVALRCEYSAVLMRLTQHLSFEFALFFVLFLGQSFYLWHLCLLIPPLVYVDHSLGEDHRIE